MENNQSAGKKAATFFRNMFLRNWIAKIAAFLIAVIVWGIVLTTQDQPRLKTLTGISVSFVNEYELHNRELVVRGNPLQEYSDITVRVNVPITGYRAVGKENINATVNLNNISAPGIYDLDINAVPVRSPAGSSIENNGISPNKIRLEIDELMTKRIPVTAVYDGVVPEGYYADADNVWLSDSSLEIRGPRQDAQLVTKAECRITLNDRTRSYNGAIDVVLVDAEGKEIDSSLFIGGIPTVTVNLPVYAKKTVPIALGEALLGEDNLAPNYELYDTVATPETLDIIGNESVLEQITHLTVQGIDVTGRREPLHEKRALIVPEGVRILNSNVNLEEIDVYVDIREKLTEKPFEALPIDVRGLRGRLKATLSQETVDINVQGRVSLVERLERSDIEAYVDLKGMAEGEHEVSISILLGDDGTTLELNTILSVAKIKVIIE